jgi:hypothetical protein
MISKPKTPFIKCVKSSALNKILKLNESDDNKISYHDLGKVILNDCYKKLNKQSGFKYAHIPSKCQEYDTSGNKLNNIMKPYNVRDCGSKRYFFPLYNTAPGYPDWFKNLSKEDLLNGRGPYKYYLKEIIDEAFSIKGEC